MKNFNIEMTKDEMIRYYANKIVEDGIRDCTEFSNIIDVNNYGNIAKYRNEILQRIYRDERVADVNIDEEGNFDMVFYTDFCPYYYEDSKFIVESEYNYNETIKKELLNDFAGYYSQRCLFDNPYISIRNLLNQFAEEKSTIEDNREAIKNIIKKVISDSGFIEKYIDGIEVYITPKNYKEFEEVFENYIENMRQEELE